MIFFRWTPGTNFVYINYHEFFFSVITCFVLFFFWLQWCCMTYLNTHYAPELSEMVQNITVRPLVVKWQSPFDHGKSDILEAALVSCLRNGFDPKYWIFLYFPVLSRKFPGSFFKREWYFRRDLGLRFLKRCRTSLCDLWSWNDSLLLIMENLIFRDISG